MSRPKCFLSSLAAALACGGLVAISPARAETLLRLDDFEPGELQIQGFELRRAGKIDVEAVGGRPRWEHELAAYAWILDSRTREPVWVMAAHDSDRVSGQSLLRRAEKTEAVIALTGSRCTAAIVSSLTTRVPQYRA